MFERFYLTMTMTAAILVVSWENSVLADDDFEDASLILCVGVYALVYNGVVVYVGQSRKMLSRIYTHRTLCGKRKPPQVKTRGIRFEEVWIRRCRVEDLDRIEKEMIQKYRPRYNVFLKAGAEMPLAIQSMIITAMKALPSQTQQSTINRRGF